MCMGKCVIRRKGELELGKEGYFKFHLKGTLDWKLKRAK